MRFRMLGPLEVVRDGGDLVRIGSPRQREILSLLLIHRNEVLSVDRLLEEVWEQEASSTSPKTLQYHVSKLRDLLEPGRPRGSDGNHVLTRSPGYVLVVDDAQVDSARFERAVTEATSRLDDDPVQARDLFEESLSSWRGQVLDDVIYKSFAQIEANRLDELRLTAVEGRLEAELAMGRHSELIPELQELTRQHPLRERLWRQLMLSLYRSGRQAEALRAYRDAAGILTEELGIDPSPELRELERQMLTQDEDLVPSAPRSKANTNLPAMLSNLIGRDQALRDLVALVDQNRLVTLTGAGGVGKTRLALEVAGKRADSHPDGVWLVELGGLIDPAAVPKAVRSALDVSLRAGQPIMATLTDYISDKDLLLVVDNCEHLIHDVAETIAGILGSSTRARVLATSREPLRVPGEVSWPVPVLTVPDPGETTPGLASSESISLFAERAKAADPSFELDDRNAPVIADICRRLDGLPLGIELAAARVRALSVSDIAQRLENRFAVLTSGSRTALAHQQALETTVAWSHDLLDADEQSLFACLGVFAGSFDLAAAERVGAVARTADADLIDLLFRLVDRSVLTVVRDGEDTRYRMLETIREYARMRLEELPDAQRVEDAHSAWALEFAREANRELIGAGRERWLRRIRASLDDLRSVLDRSRDRGDPEIGVQILSTMAPYLVEQGDQEGFLATSATADGASWLEVLVSAGDVTPELLAPVLSVRGFLLMLQGDEDAAIESLERSLELFDLVDDDTGRARAQIYLAMSLWGR